MRTLVAVALAGLLLGAPTTARAATGAKCRVPAGAEVKASARSAVVYEVGRRPPEVYACRRRTGARHLLVRQIEYSGFGGEHGDRFRVAGRYVAFARLDELGNSQVHDSGLSVRVVDLKRRARTHAEFTVGRQNDEFYGERQLGPLRVTGLVLTPSAHVAWIAQIADRIEVVAQDSAGRTLLDTGPEIDLSSLSLRRSHRLSWWRGGRRLSSALG